MENLKKLTITTTVSLFHTVDYKLSPSLHLRFPSNCWHKDFLLTSMILKIPLQLSYLVVLFSLLFGWQLQLLEPSTLFLWFVLSSLSQSTFLLFLWNMFSSLLTVVLYCIIFQFPKIMELVGLGYALWFTSRYLLFKVMPALLTIAQAAVLISVGLIDMSMQLIIDSCIHLLWVISRNFTFIYRSNSLKWYCICRRIEMSLLLKLKILSRRR